jgi:flavin reductase (DIM6/NTAB) family NADH-FMN oxidoreductase RutF
MPGGAAADRWISTLGPTGLVNLAPYSFFNLVSSRPPFLIFSSSGRKHSQKNAERTGEFVFNLATWDLRVEMNITGSDHAEHLSEAELAGLEMVPCKTVKPPRVKRSPIALECYYNKTIEMVSRDGTINKSSLVLGEVVRVHIDDSVISDGMIDMARIRPVSRLGYMDFSAVDNIFEMKRVPAQT